MYMTGHILPVLPIKHLVNYNCEPNKPHKLATDTKASLLNPRVLFCTCVVLKATAHVDTMALKMRHQSQKSFRGIFIGTPKHPKRLPHLHTYYT